jgi:hypothetical protein
VDEALLDYYRHEYPEFVSYDSWQTEPYVRPMYDIIGGKRTFLRPPSYYHGHVRMKLAIAFRKDEDREGLPPMDTIVGLVGIVPSDIMIPQGAAVYAPP